MSPRSTPVRLDVAAAAAVAIAALGGGAGCIHDIWTWDVCDVDPAGCEFSGGFRVDPSCTLTGTLQVEIGQGEQAYEALSDGEKPVVYHGPQGGSHVFGGLRVTNPAVDFPRLRAEFRVDDDVPERCDVPDPCPPGKVARRRVDLGPDLNVGAGGAVEEAGIVLFLDPYNLSDSGVITLDVQDACDRRGRVEHTYGR